ncbi:hypothetical protein [Ensifer adhaerens]
MGLNRIDWAVGVIAPQPSDHLLEVGCGHGIAVTKVCDRLDEGGDCRHRPLGCDDRGGSTQKC